MSNRPPAAIGAAARRCAAFGVAALAGCAAGGSGGADSAPVPQGQRVVLTTFVEWPSAAEVVLRVADVTAVPVRDALELAPRRYRVTLQCGAADGPGCADALQRLKQARSFVQAVEVDPRQRIPGKPDRESSR